MDGPLLHLCWYVYLLLCGVCENRKREITRHTTGPTVVPFLTQLKQIDRTLLEGTLYSVQGIISATQGELAGPVCLFIIIILSGSGVNAMCLSRWLLGVLVFVVCVSRFLLSGVILVEFGL